VLTGSGNTRTATIDLDDFTPVVRSRFYIVANVNGSAPTQANNLKTIANNVTASDFEAILTDALDETEYAVDLTTNIIPVTAICTPLLMSIGRTPTNNKPYVDIAVDEFLTPKEVTLKRRVARFDILNNNFYTGFTITRIFISNAQRKALLQDVDFNWDDSNLMSRMVIGIAPPNTQGSPAVPAANGTLTEEERIDYDNDDIPDVFDFGNSRYNDRYERNPAIFYLYPTELTNTAGGVNGKTEIVIEGELKSEGDRKYLYTLTLPESPFKIEGNKLYSIKVMRDDEEPEPDKAITFTINVATEWDQVLKENGNEDPIEAGSDSEVRLTTATWNGSEIVFDVNNVSTSIQSYGAGGATLKIEVTGRTLTSSGHVFELAIEPKDEIPEEDSWTALREAVTTPSKLETPGAPTYGGVYYKTTCEIAIPPFTATNTTLSSTLTIKGKDGAEIAKINLIGQSEE
jgi:hypothetical protein